MGEEQKITYEAIIDKAKELAELISHSGEVEFYKQAEEKIKGNEKVQGIIEQIKRKQKEAVHFEHYQSMEMVKKADEEIDRLQDELDGIPIVQVFKQTQVDINDLLQMVTNVITNTVTDKIIISTGGDPLTGETGFPTAGNGGGCGCS
jgi:cell fate (sporulation/competence/biofilm development) regulator YmcA (YheA/YmcA/DUF963 family)